jgi:hypothetical protein
MSPPSLRHRVSVILGFGASGATTTSSHGVTHASAQAKPEAEGPSSSRQPASEDDSDACIGPSIVSPRSQRHRVVGIAESDVKSLPTSLGGARARAQTEGTHWQAASGGYGATVTQAGTGSARPGSGGQVLTSSSRAGSTTPGLGPGSTRAVTQAASGLVPWSVGTPSATGPLAVTPSLSRAPGRTRKKSMIQYRVGGL